MSLLVSLNNKFADHPSCMLFCLDCGHKWRAYGNCGDRTCPECRYKAFWRLYKGYKYIVKLKNPNTLLTLTIKNQPFLERCWVQSIRSNFSKLLRRVYYKSRISGGMYCIECINQGNGWNLHLHAIIKNERIDAHKLSSDWHSTTCDSWKIDLTKIEHPVFAFMYILKDFLKTPPISGKWEEYNSAFRKFRFLSKFGDWYKLPAEDLPPVCPGCHQETEIISDYFIEEQLRKMESE